MTEEATPTSPPPAPPDPDPLDGVGPDPVFEPPRAPRAATAAALLIAAAFAVAGLVLIVGDGRGGPATSPGAPTPTPTRVAGARSPSVDPGTAPPSTSASRRPSGATGDAVRYRISVTWILRRYPWSARDTRLPPGDGSVVRRGTDTGELVLERLGATDPAGLDVALDTVDGTYAPGDLRLVSHTAMAARLSPRGPVARVPARLAGRRQAETTTTYRWERGRPRAEIGARGRFAVLASRLQLIRLATLAVVRLEDGRRLDGRLELVGWEQPRPGGEVPVYRLSVTLRGTRAGG